MKKLIYILLFITVSATAQNKYLLPNEVLVFSFSTVKGKKVVVARDKDYGYIIYRFGTDKKIEMEYPKEKNKSSWDKFSSAYYFRGGGKANAGLEIDNLIFENEGYKYVIYRDYSAGDDKTPEEMKTGIIVEKIDSGKELKNLKANENTIKGGWYDLRIDGRLKKNEDGFY